MSAIDKIKTKIPADIDYVLAKIWLEHQDLAGISPEDVKKMFFRAFQQMEASQPERWD